MRNAYNFVVKHYWAISVACLALFFLLEFLFRSTEKHFEIALSIVAASISAPSMIVLILGSRERLKEVSPSKGETIHYSERSASGRSNKSFLTRVGGATRCLIIEVTDRAIYVRPWGILGYAGEVFDLMHRVALKSIVRCEVSRSSVRIDWEDEVSGSVTVIPNDLASFKEAVNKVRPGILFN